MKNWCKSRSVWLVWFLLTMSVAAVPVRAAKAPDRPLLVSARYYTPVSRPWDKSYYHLYRFNPDGSGKTQLTFGRHDDTAACWSPDGGSVAFARGYRSRSPITEGDTQICIQAARRGASPSVILRLHNTDMYWDWQSVTWSGDASCLAVNTDRKVIFVTPQGRVLRQMDLAYHRFLRFAPDGKHYAISNENGSGSVFLIGTRSGRRTRLPGVSDGVWWDNKTFLSWVESNADKAARSQTLPMTFMNLKGSVVKRTILRPTAIQSKFFQSEYGAVAVPIYNWSAARVGPKSPLLYFDYGKPREQLFADMRTGALRRWQGQDTGVYSMQISPDGRYAYSMRGFKDVAPYGKHKDGRVRFVAVNKVQVTDMKQPNQFKDIIKGIVDVNSADWRR